MRTLLAIALLHGLLCAPARAADAEDDLGRFLSHRGLLAGPATAPAGGAPEAPSAPLPGAYSASDQRMSALVVGAMGALGVPYHWGGNSYDSGFDCSGFVRALYQQNFGLLLPRRAVDQAAATEPVRYEDLEPGDLVFFNTSGRAHSHVGVYVGDHRFIHSPRAGAVVRIEDLRVSYWRERFDGARRVAVAGTLIARPDAAVDPAY